MQLLWGPFPHLSNGGVRSRRSLKPLLALKLKDFVMILIKRVFLFMKLIPQKYLESETCMWGFSFLRVKKMWVEMQDIQQTDHWV